AVRRILDVCRARSRPAARWSRAGDRSELPPDGVIVFDEVGRLAELYTVADAAWVGGGLGGTGLHNVLEPAAAAVPVLFGRRHDRGDAHDLERAGGALRVEPGEIARALAGVEAEDRRRRMARRARRFVESGSGAAEATADLIESAAFG
ncbi:MAG: hypothetical protein R3266_09740, partial [Gemmatimonadota bacterium]|nr:hypothetical protein [Gemmatimonadota bacterium]